MVSHNQSLCRHFNWNADQISLLICKGLHMHAQGLIPLEGHEGETVTRGLERLEVNCQKYYRYFIGSADM